MYTKYNEIKNANEQTLCDVVDIAKDVVTKVINSNTDGLVNMPSSDAEIKAQQELIETVITHTLKTELGE